MATLHDTVVPHAHVGLLYEDGVFQGVLDPGKHAFPRPGLFSFTPEVSRRVEVVDLRERSLTLKGQEILTADKVAIRVSVLVYFKVVEPELAIHAVASYEDRIYEDVQLAARRFLASRNLDDILADRNEISEAVRQTVRSSATTYGVEVLRADVKDLVFPGNLRQIMNQVLETERRAAARLVAAEREAQTRLVNAQADRELERLQTEAEHERARISAETDALQARVAAEAEAERVRLVLQADLEVAQAMADNPSLAKLKELDTMARLAAGGARFIVGVEGTALQGAISAS
ncbi:MAG: slipin family protein [Myxococcales bacterium]|nr:slipin family protein [Myxococcales bacterium]